MLSHFLDADSVGVRVAVLIAVVGCAADVRDDECRCEGSVPEGRVSAACGESVCVEGVGYRCIAQDSAVAAPDACGEPGCGCDVDVPEGHISASCGESVCLGGVGYSCASEGSAVEEPGACMRPPPSCRCEVDVPEGRVSTRCGESVCLDGVGYGCVSSDTVSAQPDACGPSRPSDAPDIALITVSGHCFTDCAPEYNDEYLLAQGAASAALQTFESRGLSTLAIGFADSFYSWVDEDDNPLALGFLDLLDVLEEIHALWISGFRNPTRLIVMAHSHGTVWAHTALMVLEMEGYPVPVDVLIDLDGISPEWESDPFFVGDNWAAVIADYNAETGTTWPFDIGNAADAWNVPGQEYLQDIEDLVPNSVLINLEIWSDSLVLTDTQPNHRRDGSRADIYGFGSAYDHSNVWRPGSDAYPFIDESFRIIYGL